MHFRFLVSWYDKILLWSKHPKACWYLGFISFIDASLFPLSPLFMVLPMSFSEPTRAFYFAAIVIGSSFLGGMIGYSLGFFAFEALIGPFIQWMGYSAYYEMAMQWFQQWGYAAIVFGCLTPFIPYKIFTIGAGVMQLHFGGFLIASFLGRALRFLLIASIIRWGGPRFEPIFRKTLMKISNYQPSV